MKQTLLAAAAFGLALAGPAESQNRGDYYMSRYFLLGSYLRASVVCNNRNLAEFGFSLVGSEEFRAFTSAYPETTTTWAREGGENFNRLVMKNGIFAACQYVTSRMKSG